MNKGRKPTLSPTKITTYLDCAVKYHYIYLDKIGKFYLRAKPYYSFGSTLHQVLQQFHKEGATQTAEEMTAELEQTWISAGYKTEAQEKEHRERGEQIVVAYHAAQQERVVAQVETIATEKTITCDLGAFRLSGRVDRIDRHPDGRLEIIDYKSGRWETTEEEVASDLAMNIYQLILSHLYPDTPIFATIYCLRSGVQASAALSPEERELFQQDILTLGKEILERDYTELRPVPLDICSECDFLPRCLRYWNEQQSSEVLDGGFSEDGL
jgi:putative RecB family exonuclease